MLVILLYRQYGLTLLPGKVRMQLVGIDIGKQIDNVPVRDWNDELLSLSWRDGSASATVMLLASLGCHVCDDLWPMVGQLPVQHPHVRFVWIDSAPHSHEGAAPLGWELTWSERRQVHEYMEAPVTPYAFVISSEGRVLSKGLMNDLADFDRMFQQAGLVAPEALTVETQRV
jgi:hypothetical protein